MEPQHPHTHSQIYGGHPVMDYHYHHPAANQMDPESCTPFPVYSHHPAGHSFHHHQHHASNSGSHVPPWKANFQGSASMWNYDSHASSAAGSGGLSSASEGHEPRYGDSGPGPTAEETKEHYPTHFAEEKQYVSRAAAEMLLSLKQINFAADDSRQCYNYAQHAPYDQRREIDYPPHHHHPFPPIPPHQTQPVSVNFQMTMSCISGVANVSHSYGRHYPQTPIPFSPRNPAGESIKKRPTPFLQSSESQRLNNDSKSSNSDKVNICGICRKSYARPSTLKTHMRVHSGEKPYTCSLCPKTFTQAANLTAHARTHSGEKPFRCPVCDRRFSQSSSVTTHMRTHSGERPYRCRTCRKAFSDSSTLTKHIRIHSGEKPYQCQLCLLRFSQSGNLNRHMKVHLGDHQM